MYMTLQRTTVYAEADDLAAIKEAARRLNVPEAKILREGIHLAAMANRVWDEPFFTATHPAGTDNEDTERALDESWRDKADAYLRTRARDE